MAILAGYAKVSLFLFTYFFIVSSIKLTSILLLSIILLSCVKFFCPPKDELTASIKYIIWRCDNSKASKEDNIMLRRRY